MSSRISYTELNKYAHNMRDVSKFTAERILIMFLNWGVPTYSGLGQPVINDGEIIAKLCKQLDYECYYICNASVKNAQTILQKAFSMKHKRLVVYYSGHGASTIDTNHDEADGRDENFVFAGGLLKDDDFIECINKYFKGDHLTLIADCCHSGSIFDLEQLNDELKHKVCAISACQDHQTSKQLMKNGIFTLQLCQLYDADTGVVDIQKLNERLEWFDQKCTTFGDINELFNKRQPTRGIGAMLLSSVSDEIISDLVDKTEDQLFDQKKSIPHKPKLIIKKI